MFPSPSRDHYDGDMTNNSPSHEKIREEREAAQKHKDELEAKEQARLDDENR